MLLAIDIGNTNINLGVFSGKRIVRRYSLPSGAGTYCSLLKKICARHNVQEAIVCSVVPNATALLAKELQL
ncbi:MAG: type III pantothenate kinase, partial [Candidatus Omnitrophica bacterium]|nr:type III pantothenate kinase [Candidatus Omnitrophota bacterium]